jgi:hypothetical protein
MIEDLPGVLEFCARMQNDVEINNVLVVSGRRPHGLPPMVDGLGCRAGVRGSGRYEVSSGRLGFDLAYAFRAVPVDGDPPWLHRLRQFADELDLQKAVVEARTAYLNIVG